MEIEKLANIEITDEDILWVEEMMGGKVHFDSASVNVLKNMDSVDIQAFPEAVKQLYWLLSWQFLQRNGHIPMLASVFYRIQMWQEKR